jgi:hypothetical protein
MEGSPNNSIELRAETLYRLATQCLSCKLIPIEVGIFAVPRDVGHEIKDKCWTCQCASDQHSPIEYMLQYEWSTNKCNFDELNNMLRSLFDASIEFAHFLLHVTRSTKEDPFFTGFTRMIEEEKDISVKVQPNELNLQLVQQLEVVLHNYKQRIDEMRDHHWNNNLSVLTDRIKTISEYSMIHE